MKHIILLLLSMLFFATCNLKNKKNDSDKERLNRICDDIIYNYSIGNYHGAMLLLKRNTVLISESEIDTMEAQMWQQKREGVFAQYGKILISELVSERNISDFASKRIYVLRFRYYILKFVFIMYKGAEKWAITGFKFDDNLSEML